MGNRSGKMNAKTFALTRRQILKAGGVLVPAAALAPGIFSRSALAQSATTFDYYISPNGSDSNAGTLSSPWAITAINTHRSNYAGKRVGLLPGKYDVSSLIPASSSNAALNIMGGTASSRTYIASSDASGVYSPRTATLDAKGASGYYGGKNSNAGFVLGNDGSIAGVGYWTVDGLVLTGFSVYCICVGNAQGGGPLQPNVTIQNCEFTGGSAQNSTAASGVNLSQISVFTANACLLHNNYHHDNLGWTDNQHFSAIYVWGLSGGTTGTIIQYCTLINSGDINGKNGGQNNATLQYNYIDMTNKTPSGGQESAGVMSFSEGSSKSATSYFHHNIIVAGVSGMDLTNTESPMGWYGPFECYNNTWIMGANSTSLGFRFWEQVAGSRPAKFYNNLIHCSGPASLAYGYVSSNTDIFSICDYNWYASGPSTMFTTVPPGQQASAPGLVTYSSLAAWAAAIGGLEAHSISGSSSPFSNVGALAEQFQIQSGSSAYQAGRVGGTPSGAVCNIGAWDGLIKQIGCDFAGGSVLPDPPQLSVS